MLNLKSKIINTNLLHAKQSPKVQQLKNKLVIVSSLIILILFALIVFITRGSMKLYQNKSIDDVSQKIADVIQTQDDIDLNKIWDNIPYTVNLFVISEDKTTEISVFGIVKSSEAKMMDLYKRSSGKTGTIDNYRYRIIHLENRTIGIFIDITKEQQSQQNTILILMLILIASMILLLIIISFLSRLVIRPFAESYEQQKQFITDASHDLKTPLTIIMSNADVLEFSTGKNQWTDTIKKETKKMSELIDDMLTLSKVESFTEKQSRTFINISDVLNNMIDELSLLWEERNIKVIRNIPNNIVINCNNKQIDRLFSVIMQNATKYCKENGTFEVTVSQQKNKVLVSMYNDADLDENIDYSKLFERFYRSDSSRNSSTGGHGIGLSIAKKICELEGYTIVAEKKSKGIVFKISLS